MLVHTSLAGTSDNEQQSVFSFENSTNVTYRQLLPSQELLHSLKIQFAALHMPILPHDEREHQHPADRDYFYA